MQKQCKARPTTDLETCHHVFDIPIESRCSSSSRNFKTTLEKKDLKDEMNSRTYKNTLIALQSVYSILGKMDQAKAVGTILNGL